MGKDGSNVNLTGEIGDYIDRQQSDGAWSGYSEWPNDIEVSPSVTISISQYP